MTSSEYRDALSRLGLTQSGAARLLGVNPVSGRRWARDGVTGTAEILLNLLVIGRLKIEDVEAARNP